MMDIVTGVGVLDKAMTIVRALHDDGPSSLGDLQGATGMPRATAHRLLSALEAHGFVRRDDGGRYSLGLALVPLGRAAAAGFPFAERARPVLAVLRDETGESVQLFVREGTGRRCVVSLQSPHGLRWIVPEGALLPLQVGSAGRILAPDGPLGVFDGSDAGGAVGRARTTLRARATGTRPWVESVEEREPGVASVSAPVVDRSGSVVAAVSVSGPVERLTRAPGRRFGEQVLGAARSVSDAL